jgi:hypothetical protein
MDTPTKLQASEITDVNDAKPSDASVDSGYETAAIETPTEISGNLTSKPPLPVNEKEGDLPIEGDATSDVRTKDGYLDSLEKRLEQVESELKELKSRE